MTNKLCPILALNPQNAGTDKDWWEQNSFCLKRKCAWWDRHGERCYFVTGQLAIASVVRSELLNNYGVGLPNPYKEHPEVGSLTTKKEQNHEQK